MAEINQRQGRFIQVPRDLYGWMRETVTHGSQPIENFFEAIAEKVSKPGDLVSVQSLIDNVKLYFGTDQDASLYFDGTNLWIKTDEVTPSDLIIDCGEGKTLKLNQPVYDDLQVSISNIRVPAANAPTERLYNHGIGGGVTFPVLGFAVNDYIYFDVQTNHACKLNTVLENHMHFILPNTTNIGDKFQWQLDVIAAAVDVAFAVPTGSPFTAEHTIVASDDTHHRIMDIADIPAVNSTVSTLYSCVLTRIAASANEYASEVYVKFNDCHQLINTLGSRQEYTK